MNTEQVTHKPLKTEFNKNGFRFTQLRREGDYAIFHKVGIPNNFRSKEIDVGFEVVVVGRHDDYELGGVKIEAAEVMPSTSQWGSNGWTYPTLLQAETRFNLLLDKKPTMEISVEDEEEPTEEHQESTPVDSVPSSVKHGGGRPRKEQPEIKFPDGEFTMQELADFNGMPKANVYIIAKLFITEVRRESRGKGRPTVIYKKS